MASAFRGTQLIVREDGEGGEGRGGEDGEMREGKACSTWWCSTDVCRRV